MKFGPSAAILSKLRRSNICSPSTVVKLRPLFSNVTFFSSAPNMEEQASDAVEKSVKRKRNKPIPPVLKYKLGQFLPRSEVDYFIETKLKECNVAAISIFMTRSASRSEKTSSVTFLIGYFPAIAARLSALQAQPWTFWQIAAVLSGLKCLRETEDGIQNIIEIMTHITRQSLDRGASVAPDDITLMLSGLGRIVAREHATQNLLSVITEAITKCTGDFTNVEIIKCLRSLQGKSTEQSEVRALLSVLTERLRAVEPGTLSAESIGHIMFAAYRFDSECVEVKSFLGAVTSHIESSKEGFDAQSMGDAIYGLQKMSSDHIEVRTLISTLLSKSINTKKDILPQTSCNAFSGMRGLKSESAEVRQLLLSLVPNVQGSEKCYHPRGIADFLLGMQNMNSDSIEVRAVLTVLLRHVTNGTGNMDAQSVGNVLYGMQNMKSNSTEVKKISAALVRYVQNSEGVLTLAHIERSLKGLQGMEKDNVELKVMLETLLAKVKSTEKIIDDDVDTEDSPQVKALQNAIQSLV